MAGGDAYITGIGQSEVGIKLSRHPLLLTLDAVREAAQTRLRPILMISVATISGHFPLTLVSGAGAAARNSIGLVLVGGMAIGTIFTLFVIPSIYMLVARDHSKDRRTESAISTI
jgi:multidrug efflux pump